MIFLLINANVFADDREKRFPVDKNFSTDYTSNSLVGTLTNLDRVFNTCTVHASENPLKIVKNLSLEDFKYKKVFGYGTLKDYEEDSEALGVTVYDGEKIIHQRFLYERNETDLMPSYSMAKSLISLMIGIALDEGMIKSLDDPVSRYSSQLSESPYKNVTLRNLLRMSSGVPYSEEYNGRDDQQRFLKTALGKEGSIIDAINSHKKSPGEQGKKFNYASIESAVLTEVLRSATGKDTCQYFEEKIWKPIGAESEGRWVTDSHGNALGFTWFLSRQDDFLKIGIMLANNGFYNGRQIVSSSYLEEATNLKLQPISHQIGKVNKIAGYGYQFWLTETPGRFSLWGVRGQSMYIDQRTKKIILINSAWSKPSHWIKRYKMFLMFEEFANNYRGGDSSK